MQGDIRKLLAPARTAHWEDYLFNLLVSTTHSNADRRYSMTLRSPTKYERSNRGKRKVSGIVVDTVHDHYERVIDFGFPVPPTLRLDVDAYREWMAWCVEKHRRLYSRRPLEACARESSTFVDRLEEELGNLA